MDAYKLESETAKVPRVVIAGSVYEHARAAGLPADPFAQAGRTTPVTNYIRVDRDAVAFLDLLHRDVTRSHDKRLVTADEGFTVRWQMYNSSHEHVVANCRRLAGEELAKKPEDSVKQKYRWLQHYVDGHCPTQAVERGER